MLLNKKIISFSNILCFFIYQNFYFMLSNILLVQGFSLIELLASFRLPQILLSFSFYLTLILEKFVLRVITKPQIFDICIKKNYNVSSIFFFKFHFLTQADFLVDILAEDHLGEVNRFKVNYYLNSSILCTKFTISLFIDEISNLKSLIPVFFGANWLEREVWDLFGIYFINHPDLRRLLTDYGFSGFPLRKDFPLSGYTEIFYSDYLQNIVHVPISLAQDFRVFFFKNVWI